MRSVTTLKSGTFCGLLLPVDVSAEGTLHRVWLHALSLQVRRVDSERMIFPKVTQMARSVSLTCVLELVLLSWASFVRLSWPLHLQRTLEEGVSVSVSTVSSEG